jgi:hypothetical protein
MVSTTSSSSNDMRASSHSYSTIMAPSLPPPTNITSSSSSTNLEVYLISNEIAWIIYNGYIHHMTSNKMNLQSIDMSIVTFGDNQGKIIGVGSIEN